MLKYIASVFTVILFQTGEFMQKNSILDMAAGILFAAALILAWLITSVEAVAYWIPGYYEHEYRKYQVTEDVDMEMDDLLQVTEEMMDYLRGGREDLHVMTTVGGQSREFFNEREIAHMEDVRGLFIGGLRLRAGALVLAAAMLALIALRRRKETLYILARSFRIGSAFIAAAALILGLVMSTDFTRYFTIFHQIFFDNDLWILNPATDLLINIVPEPFFMDTALYIGLIFGGGLILALILCTIIIRRRRQMKGFYL